MFEKSIAALVKNRDLTEQTDRSYIVGYLAKALVDGGVVGPNGYSKSG